MEQNYTEAMPVLPDLPIEFFSSEDDVEDIKQKYLQHKMKVYKLYECLYCKVHVKKSNKTKHNKTSMHIRNQNLLRFH